MSSYKKRAVAALTAPQAHAAAVVAAWPAAQPVMAAVRTRLEAVRAAHLQAEWQASKQTAAAAMRQLCNEWMEHSTDLPTGASSRALYAEAFGPIDDSSAVDQAALQSLRQAAHRAAVVAAESQLQLMRASLLKMRNSWDTLRGHVSSLQESWCTLEAVTSTPPLLPLSDFDSLATQLITGASALDQLTLDAVVPTDIVVATNASLNLAQCISALVALLRMYERDLHTKHVLVDALARMIVTTPYDATDSHGDEAGRLLQQPAVATAAAERLAATSTQPLAMYLAAWLMEPDLSSETLSATAHLFEMQLK